MPRLRVNYKFTVLHTPTADRGPNDDVALQVEEPASVNIDGLSLEDEREKVRVT